MDEFILYFFEGDDDRAFFEGLKKLRLLPGHWQPANRMKNHPGKDGLVDQLLPVVRPVNGAGKSAIVFVDLDDSDHSRCLAWFQRVLEQKADPGTRVEARVSPDGRLGSFRLISGSEEGRAVLVPVGIPGEENAAARVLGLDRFALDDYLYRLLQQEQIYAGIDEFRSVPHAKAMKKIAETTDLFRANGIEVRHTKRLFQIFRAVAAFRPSTATLIDRLLRHAASLPKEILEPLLHPLLEDLQNAENLLKSDWPSTGSTDSIQDSSP